ncbi:quinolinate synthase NadA [Echinicola marina]|uniref:quinolinate synthase NadA n=1 Tax=Echinicola marina TaxID=2859768 RepID=UPI001CF6B640|nr:quinolinate synthase NadA [Echinicola marina]UCS93317.1 quinolinate synthase NadA [Echinicola marina]
MEELLEKIHQLKQHYNAVILAHYYQDPAIQDLADFVGDSLDLSRKARDSDAEVIVFAGVHFMAETAKILNPSKKVLLPDLDAGCSLADSCTGKAFKEWKMQYPDHISVTYINCSAEVKAESDWVCTSANALKVIQAIPEDKQILFAPDKNLGNYLIKETGRNMVLWNGECMVHKAFSMEKLMKLWQQYPAARLIAHPESEDHVIRVAEFIGSTSALLNYVQDSDKDTFIVATEHGILHEMQRRAPEKLLIPAPSKDNNSCACSECAFMKMNTMEKIYECLLHGKPEIQLDESLMKSALRPIERMLSLD